MSALTRPVFLSALVRLCDAEAAFAESPTDDYKQPLPPRPDDAEYFHNLAIVVQRRCDAVFGRDFAAHDDALDSFAMEDGS